VVNVPCLVAMLKSVHFRDVRVVSEFDLVNRHADQVIPHAVIHARAA
jgi:hypothetical protein